MLFFCSAFIDYIKGRFEAIKDIYSLSSPYQIKLHLSSLCCVIVPLNSLHHTNSFSLDHDWSWWQQYRNTSFVPSLSFCVFPHAFLLWLVFSSSIFPSNCFSFPPPFTPSFVPSRASCCSPSVTLDSCSYTLHHLPFSVLHQLLSLRIPSSEFSSTIRPLFRPFT